MLDAANQKLLEQIKGELETIMDGVDGMRESNIKQHIQNSVKQAKEDICRLVSDHSKIVAATPLNCPEVIRMGGGIKRGVISKKELEEAEEIRVSIRPPKFLGSTELFTLRHLEPGDYHLTLVAIPRNEGSG